MSAVCIIAPVVIAGWPIFSAAVMAAASSLGYQLVVYQKLLEEIRARGFVIAEQETTEDRSIHLTVRQWES